MNVYDMINNRIISILEQGQLPPWKKSWNAQTNIPRNLVSKKPYRGINVWTTITQDYDSPWWLTFKQCAALNGRIIKGSKSTPIVYWNWIDRRDGDDTDNTVSGKVPLLRFYNAFHISQTEGITYPPSEESHNIFDPIAAAEEIIINMPNPPLIQYMGNRAVYNVKSDTVTLPPKHTFDSAEELAGTTFHELIHSTLHESRLNRKASINIHNFGIEEKSKEELVAEMGAAHLCGHCGIEQKTIENSAAYIAGWLKALKNDKTLLVHAAAQAQKAADYILNIKPDVPEEAAA